MTSNAVDYFATLGKVDGNFLPKPFASSRTENRTVRSAKEVWNDAIMDIVVVGTENDSLLDEKWTKITHSVEGEELEMPHIAFRRRKESRRSDHITEIRVITEGGIVPSGFELIISGDTNGHLNNLSGFLAVKRAVTTSTSLLFGEPLIDDIAVLINDIDEELPDRFKEADIVGSQELLANYSLALHSRPAMGLCDLSYQSATIDRYPLKDHKALPLPVLELPMFVFPNDLRLTFSPERRFPMPVFFTLVFTDQNGEHLYTACLRFYEQVKEVEIQQSIKEMFGNDTQFVMPENGALFCPKVVSVVSRMPFYRAMRRFLRQIYSLSLSTITRPLEMYIGSLVGSVPLPVEGGRPIHVMLDAELISPGSKAMAPIIFDLPPQRFFPPMDLDFAAPLRCLSVDHLLAVFTLLLRESKILFLSCSNALLTETMETLRSLLFPLAWASCFVSRLPSALTGLLEAPGGFMIGLHVAVDDPHSMNSGGGTVAAPDHNTGNSGNSSSHCQEERSLEFQAMRTYIDRLHRDHPLVPNTYIVDLTNDAIYVFDGKNAPIELTTSNIEAVISVLSPGPKLRLRYQLLTIAREYRIAPQLGARDEFDSAFELQQPQFLEDEEDDTTATAANGGQTMLRRPATAAQWEQFPTLALRDGFMSFMTDILGNYQRYVIPPAEDMLADTYRTFREEFRVDKYLDDAGPVIEGAGAGNGAGAGGGLRQLLESLMESQMFAVLLQKRTEGLDFGLVYFEESAALMRELGLSVGGHRSGIPSPAAIGGGSTGGSHSSIVNGSGSGGGELSLQERGRNLLAGNNNNANNSLPSCSQLPVPMYQLLQAERRWSAIGVEAQEKILAIVAKSSAMTSSNSGSGSGVSLSPPRPGAATAGTDVAVCLTFLALNNKDSSNKDVRETLSNNFTRSRTRSGVHALQQQQLQQLAFSAIVTKTAPAQNEKLRNLLCLLYYNNHLEVDEAVTVASSGSGPGVMHLPESSSTSTLSQSLAAERYFIRSELGRNQELHLDNPKCGPLVLPGPIKSAAVDGCAEMVAGKDEVGAFSASFSATPEEWSYREGWPTLGGTAAWQSPVGELDRKTGKESKWAGTVIQGTILLKALHPRLPELMKARATAVEISHRAVLLFVRSPAERLAFEYSGRMRCAAATFAASCVAAKSLSMGGAAGGIGAGTVGCTTIVKPNSVLSTSSSTRISSSQLKGMEAEADMALSLNLIICDAAAVSLTLLATRCVQFSCTASAGDVLQMLGIISQLEQMRLLPLLHESSWRSVLVACAATGGELMRRVACVVFASLGEACAARGQAPDALSYGQYMQALSAKTVAHSITAEHPLDRLDAFLYLEEMGYTWYTQRAALTEQQKQQHASSHAGGGGGGPEEGIPLNSQQQTSDRDSSNSFSLSSGSSSTGGKVSLSAQFSQSFSKFRASSSSSSAASSLGVNSNSDNNNHHNSHHTQQSAFIDDKNGVSSNGDNMHARSLEGRVFTESASVVSKQLSLVRCTGGAAMVNLATNTATSSTNAAATAASKRVSIVRHGEQQQQLQLLSLCFDSPAAVAHTWFPNAISTLHYKQQLQQQLVIIAGAAEAATLATEVADAGAKDTSDALHEDDDKVGKVATVVTDVSTEFAATAGCDSKPNTVLSSSSKSSDAAHWKEMEVVTAVAVSVMLTKRWEKINAENAKR